MQKIQSTFREANMEINFFIGDIKNILLFCVKIFSETVCYKFTYDIPFFFFFFCMTFIMGSLCTLSNS